MGYSGSGQNRIGSLGGHQIFTNNVTAATTSLTLGTNDSGPIGYGTVVDGVAGVNGAQAIGFSKWLIQPIGTWGAGSAQVYAIVLGTTDKNTTGYVTNPNTANGLRPDGRVDATTANWFPLPAMAQEGTADSFQWANPLYGNNSTQAGIVQWAETLTGTTLTDALYVPAVWTAIRVVIVTVAGAAGSPTNPNCNVLVFAVE